MLLLLALADCYIIIIVFVVCVLIRRYLVNTVHELTRAWFRCVKLTVLSLFWVEIASNRKKIGTVLKVGTFLVTSLVDIL